MGIPMIWWGLTSPMFGLRACKVCHAEMQDTPVACTVNTCSLSDTDSLDFCNRTDDIIPSVTLKALSQSRKEERFPNIQSARITSNPLQDLSPAATFRLVQNFTETHTCCEEHLSPFHPPACFFFFFFFCPERITADWAKKPCILAR